MIMLRCISSLPLNGESDTNPQHNLNLNLSHCTQLHSSLHVDRDEALNSLMYRFNIKKICEGSRANSPIMQTHGPFPAPPGPRATPFYIAARTAPSIELSFIVKGMKGELLDFPVENMDLAFLLQQILKRKGWKPATIHNSMTGFLEVPLIRVQERGKEGETGILNTQNT